MGRVLVLGRDTRSFLSVIRSLGRARHEVHVAWCPADTPALRSKYIQTVHEIPQYDPDGLAALLAGVHFDLVIPCDDFAILPLQQNRARLEAAARLYLLSDEAFALCSDKRKTYELAERLGIALPRQRIATTVLEVEEAAGVFGWPLVLKPMRSVVVAGARGEVRKVRSTAEIKVFADAMLAGGPLLVQENFIGIGAGVEVLCYEGEVLAAFEHERVHEPVQGGGSTYRKSVPLSPDRLEAASRLMRAMRYTGVGMVEFKVNPATGSWVLMEINGRFWGSLPLSLAAGADFPRYLYEMLVEGRREFPRQYSHGVYARNWMLDLRWLAGNLLTDRRDPTLMTRPLWKVMLEPLNLPREHSDTFTWDDPSPGFEEVAQFLRRELWPLVWMFPPLRLYMAARAAWAVRPARRVLFVCKGNICRSPFAEQYLRGLGIPGIDVDSAGHYPQDGRSSPGAATAAAKAFGVRLAEHRSHTLSAGQVRWADVIFIFDQEQDAAVRRAFPDAAGKIHYLGLLAPGWHIQITDPWGRDADAFMRGYRQIQTALHRIAGLRGAIAPSRLPDRPPPIGTAHEQQGKGRVHMPTAQFPSS
jgi:protein-tyrosine-phosphatase/predicted ATP-grasp superfamily ATP-dependent carboligase